MTWFVLTHASPGGVLGGGGQDGGEKIMCAPARSAREARRSVSSEPPKGPGTFCANRVRVRAAGYFFWPLMTAGDPD